MPHIKKSFSKTQKSNVKTKNQCSGTNFIPIYVCFIYVGRGTGTVDMILDAFGRCLLLLLLLIGVYIYNMLACVA